MRPTSKQVILAILESHERTTYPNGVGSVYRCIEGSSHESIANKILIGLNQLG